MSSFSATLNQMLILFAFICAGFLLVRWRVLPEGCATVISKLEFNLFLPALTLSNCLQNCDPAVMGEKWTLILWGAGFVAVLMVLGWLLTKLFRGEAQLKRIIQYSLTISNYGYMGNAVVLGIFGSQILFDYMIFLLPLSVVTNSWGVMMLVPKAEGHGGFFRRVCTPPIIAVVMGVVLGVTRAPIPAFCTKVLEQAGQCMAPLAMILTGVTLGQYSLKKILSIPQVYGVTALRLVGIPLLIGFVARLCGLDDDLVRLMMCAVAMPLGLNTVVFPAAHGQDTTVGASMALISNVLALVTIPLILSIFI